ncbi:MAG: hypothetical protein HY005_01125 [Candidatus Staskawiczbacteria bacterium]|nr:hypothetical protein [Candidatus Staskawiczbacteria bacterium]MBI3337208.1 hypothetical protein [Candidatus Staskawiczbacteria bacterium]
MAKSKIIILAVILLVLITGFWFKDNPSNFLRTSILKIYDNFNNNFQNFQKTEIGNLITEISKEVFTPPPLNAGGKANQAVLTKVKIIAESNIQRFDNGGLLPLIENVALNAAAKAKAEDMFLKQYFEHVSPSGMSPAELVSSYGYDYIVTGENLILGNFENEKELVQLWMDSPGHRANILNGRYTEIGVAIIKGSYEGNTVWIGVQEFGLPLSACPKPMNSLKNQIDSYKSQLNNLIFQINEKRNELNNTKHRGEQYNNLADQYNELVRQYQLIADESRLLITQYNNQVNFFNQCAAGK